MGKAKLTNFAQVLRLLPLLSDSEKATLRDVLRPQTVRTRKAKQDQTPQASATPLLDSAVLCGACGHPQEYEDHFPPSPHYHAFEGPRAKPVSKKPKSETVKVEPSTEGAAAA